MKKVLLSMLVLLAGTSAWAQTFSYDGNAKKLTITVDTDLSSSSDFSAVTNNMDKNNPDSVAVVGGGVVNDAFVHAILFKDNVSRSVAGLDMNGVRVKDLSYATFCNGNNFNQNLISLGVPQNVSIPKLFYYDYEVKLNSIKFAEGTTSIEAKAFELNNNISIVDVQFSSTIKNIGDCAFAGLKAWETVELNEGVEVIGNSAFYLQSAVTQKVLVVPSSVLYIGPGAFLNRRYQEVYFRSTNAPLCPLGEVKGSGYPGGLSAAFGAETLMGNNGFHSSKTEGSTDDDANTGYANRENYRNNGVYFCKLHYPTDLSDELRAKYTDITKTYQTWMTESGSYNGWNPKKIGQESKTLVFQNWSTNTDPGVIQPGYKDTYAGESYIWPSQTQWMRSYITASYHLCWDGITNYPSKNQLTDEQIALLRANGFDENTYSVDSLNYIAYIGTRQFVFADPDATTTPDYPLNVKGGKWWSLCVPFNMTKKMVDESLGENTQVCLFSSVNRKFDEDADYNHITLQFRKDVYLHKTEKSDDGTYADNWSADAAACSDDDIVIYAHEAYMVKPTKTDDAKCVVKNYAPQVGSPIPTYVHASKTTVSEGQTQTSMAYDDGKQDAEDYRFIGNYITSTDESKVYLPTYAYYFGRLNADDEGQFWFNAKGRKIVWTANTAVVETKYSDLGVEDNDSFFFRTKTENQSKQVHHDVFGIGGDDDVNNNNGNTTAVTKVEIVAGEDASPVYTLNGQMVSSCGANNLPKGVYIMNGKKFVVK